MGQGAEELGNATIFGGYVNPVQVLLNTAAQRQKQKQAQLLEAKKQRDAVHDYNDKFNPEGKWDPLKQRAAEIVNDHRNKSYNLIEAAGNDPSKIAAAKRDIINGQGTVNQYLAEQEGWKNNYEHAQKVVEDNIKAGLYKPDSRSALRDVLYDHTGKLKADNEIRAGMAQLDDIVQHPNNYNRENVLRKHVEGLPEFTNDYISNQTDAYGNPLSTTKIVEKLPYELVDEGNTKNFKTDKEGNRIVKVNETLYNSVESNPFTKKLMDAEIKAANPNQIGEPTVEQKYSWIAKNLAGKDAAKRDIRLHTIPKPNEDNGNGYAETASIVGSGDNAFKPYDQIGEDKKLGFDSIAFGYNADKEIPFATSQGSSANATGKFSGLRTNPSTGKKEMEFVSAKPYGAPGEKEIKYVPYDEKTFEQVLNSLPAKKRTELRKLKTDFDKQFDNKKEYVLDEPKLNQEADSIDKFYNDNKENVGTPEFDNKFNSLLNSLGINEGKSKKNFWFWQDNELKIGDKIVPVGDKEQLKQVLYDLQKGRYKKITGAQETQPEDFNSKWAKFKSGDKLVGPDGKTYIKK